MPRMFFNLDIGAAEYQAVYSGMCKNILVRAESGESLQFPANELRKFVSHSGVKGRFEITFSQAYKLLDLKKLS